MNDRVQPRDLAFALLANLLIVGLFACASSLSRYAPDYYYRIAQEDELVEWSTFWSFVAAAGVSFAAAFWQRRTARRIPWFLLGVGVFCMVVALEEISWGQRVLGYRPPTYFLETNYQQELNLHNLMGTEYRRLGLGVVIAGYGLVLPLLALVPAVGRLFRRVAVVPPPAALAPAFLVMLLIYVTYPWKLTGEWVEFALGVGFLFAALARAIEFRPAVATGPDRSRLLLLVFLAWLAVIGIGSLQAAFSRDRRGSHSEYVRAARGEVEALRRDLSRGRLPRSCGVNKRLHAYVEKYRVKTLLSGEFARLTRQGMPNERAEFFLDPWNLPYWVRHYCGEDGSYRAYVYSFGPNRKRDSSIREIRGDDVGAIIR